MRINPGGYGRFYRLRGFLVEDLEYIKKDPKEDAPQRIEDGLADAIADLWEGIEKKAAAEKTDETLKNEALIFEWAAKLGEILRGPKK